jgi:DNA (cytosine-5)-methyltransferase 1
MKFLSICSGIEAASVAFAPLGWKAAAFSEIEPFPNAVLAHHYPDIPNLGDMTKFKSWPDQIFIDSDLIVGGPPCQAFSVAGQRKGLEDDRGNITLIYVELINHADEIRAINGLPPVVVVYENVPGLLSDKSNAFGSFLGSLSGEDEALEPSGKKWTNAGVVLGPERSIAWRTLDAQYFGLAQRRKRIFLVGSARDGFDPAEVLFEFEGLRRDSAPSREAGKEVAGTIAARTGISRNNDSECVTTNRMVAFGEYSDDGTASAMKARDYKDATDLIAYAGTVGTLDRECGTSKLNHQTCVAGHIIPAVAYSIREDASADTFSATPLEVANAIQAHQPSVQSHHAQVFIAQTIPIHDSATRFSGKRGDKQDGKGNGLGIGDPGAPMNTLTKGDRHAVAYSFDALSSNSMKSSNPLSGCRQVDISSCLDTTTPEPSKNQGGIAVLQPVSTYSTPAIGNIVSDDLASTMTRNTGAGGETQNPAFVVQPVYELHGQDSRVTELKNVCGTVSAAYGAGGGNIPVTIQPLVYDTTNITSPQNGSNPKPGDPCFTLAKGQHPPLLTQPVAPTLTASNDPSRSPQSTEVTNQVAAIHAASMAVRRLTPTECERLQGFPDGYTNIPWRKQPESPDGPRYKALGNSWAVPVARWVGQRIKNHIEIIKGESDET